MRSFRAPVTVTDAGDTKVNETFSTLKKQTSIETRIVGSWEEDGFNSTQRLIP